MTLTLSPARAAHGTDHAPPARESTPPSIERFSLALLLGATGVLYLWNLAASGWANSFYAAAVQAGSQSWTAMLFGSSDAANAITVDKPPAALWVMDISARIFGFNSWSLLAPQAVEGILAVAVLYFAVRRVGGHWAGILAGAIAATTPAATLMFRFDNPDALLVLLLSVAAYCTVRALEKDSRAWWLPLAGVAIGFGFLTKMMQAFLVLPAFGLAYLIAAHAPLRTRLVRSVAAVGAAIASAGWYLALVELWPESARPYIGGSQNNSILELTLGYNGFGRLTGDEVGGLGNLNHDVGWARLFGSEMGGQIAWLIPAAIVLGTVALWITRTAPRTDPTRASLLLWLGWLVVTAVVFSFANGILHPYYTVALAPAIAGTVGLAGAVLWRNRSSPVALGALSGASVVTTLLAYLLLDRSAHWQPWLRPAVLVVGVAAAVLLLVAHRTRFARAILIAAVTAALAGPAAYSVATAATPHSGAIPSAGPSSGRGVGGMFNGSVPGAALTAALRADASNYTWVAAVVGSSNASGYQLATGHPVMAVGGFNGTDPAPTLAEFQRHVADGAIHYFVSAQVMGGMRGGGVSSGSDAAKEIAAWVEANFPAATIDGTTVYDLTATT